MIEAGGLVVMPGFVDLHAHLREPGSEEKETIATGARAAARGGFTTICCMPNTDPAIDSRATLDFVVGRAAAAPVRVLPVAAVSKGRKGEELVEMAELAEGGAVAFSDDGSPVLTLGLLRSALAYSKVLGAPIMDHCEEPSYVGCAMHEGSVSTRLGLRGQPAAAEEAMVARGVQLAELTGGRFHVAHMSTIGALDIVRRAKERGLPVTAEVTPHHLTLTDEWVGGDRTLAGAPLAGTSDGDAAYDTNTKVNPPLRPRRHVEAMIEGLADGSIDAIATDHAPHATVDKLCEYEAAAYGISGFETAFGALMTLAPLRTRPAVDDRRGAHRRPCPRPRRPRRPLGAAGQGRPRRRDHRRPRTGVDGRPAGVRVAGQEHPPRGAAAEGTRGRDAAGRRDRARRTAGGGDAWLRRSWRWKTARSFEARRSARGRRPSARWCSTPA